jgi:hypothetical protein
MKHGDLDLKDGSINRWGALKDLTGVGADPIELLARGTDISNNPIGYGIAISADASNLTLKGNGINIRLLSATIYLTYANAGNLRGTWTFPSNSFSSSPRVWAFLNNGLPNATPNFGQISSLLALSVSASSVLFNLARIVGQTDFSSGDVVSVNAFAWGIQNVI